jgi:hypothetical protein
VLGFGVSVHVLVPLHAEFMHEVGVHVTVVPRQLPALHASLNVHRSPSLHSTDVRHAHVPPAFVQRYVTPPQVCVWHRSWLAALHVYTVPPEQIPSAPAAPHPTHACPFTIWFVPQLSAHAPFVVRQPPVPALQSATQHWFPGPTPHVVGVALQLHVLQTSPVPEQYRVHVPG